MQVPQPQSHTPTRGNAFSRWLGRSILAMMGWRIEGQLPNVNRCVVIGAPHTSNWDFVVGMSAMLALSVRASWMGKHQIFIWPVKYIWHFLGGIPTFRDKHLGAVAQRVALFQERESLYLGITPEGTRERVDQWKSGFYHIADQAGVPIFPVSFDYDKKVFYLGELFYPTGDVEADIAQLRQYYQQFAACYPEKAG
ncbi:pseudouridine synthase, RluD [gamma proteobacterium HTCC5015]|nr:pseudouridine synthase, RluD [gamma proteobacterium HTCC5015]